MIKYNVISNARGARGECRMITMKRIFAIFLVILTFGLGLPNDGFSGGSCKLHLCKTDEDFSELLSTDGITNNDNGGKGISSLEGKMCYHCDINNISGGIGDDDCSFNTYVATVTPSETKLFVCEDDAGDDDSWKKIELNSLTACSGSPLINQGLANSTCVLADSSGNDVNNTHVVSGPCMKCSCNSGYRENSSKTGCIADTSAQETCEKSPSYGKWDETNSKCLCGAEDRAGKDDKGEGQEYAKPNVSCKCSNPSHEWNDADGKCVDPNAGDADACDKSGGEWKDGECKCDENSRGLKPVSGDKTCECIDNNKKYSQSDKMCVLTDQANCENTGGEWDDKKQTCTCDSKKNIKQEPSNQKVCICKNDDYGPDPTVKGCELTQDAKDRKTDFENLKESCEKWDGAKWFPETWERELSNGKENENWEPKKWKCTCNPSGGQISADNDRSCVCDIGKGYYLKSKNSPYRCEQTDCATLQKKCNSSIGGGTRYIDEGTASGRQICDCKCNDNKKVYSLAENMCIDAPNPVQFLCNVVKPANSATIDKDNNCVCISTGRRPENGKCPPAANSGSASGGGASSSLTPSLDDINKAKEKVSAAYNALKKIEFEKSHWKTASGNFNGARLTSDSIAGVVLGTVGGVVTSNVIKKNQVKGGFENLQCTVGGQMVADYGDQFQVGIR